MIINLVRDIFHATILASVAIMATVNEIGHKKAAQIDFCPAYNLTPCEFLCEFLALEAVSRKSKNPVTIEITGFFWSI